MFHVLNLCFNLLRFLHQGSHMVPQHHPLLQKQTCTMGWSRIWNTKAVVWSTAAGRTLTSATSTSLSSALMSSATWRLLMYMSLTSTSHSTATPRAPPPCLQTTATAPLHLALMLLHTAMQVQMGQRGAARAPSLLPRLLEMWANTGFILKRNNWVQATTASTPTGPLHILITAPTAVRPVSPRPLQPPPLSPARSVTILTSRAPTITTHTLATPLASTSTPTSTHPGDPTAAPSSTACPWLLPTAPQLPAGTSLSTPRCHDHERTKPPVNLHQRLIQIDALLMKEFEQQVEKYVRPFERQKTTEKCLLILYRVISFRLKNTCQTIYTKTNCVFVGEPNSSVRKCHLRLHPVHPSSYQFKCTCVCALEVNVKGLPLRCCVGEKHSGSVLSSSRWRSRYIWECTRDQLFEFAVEFTLMARAVLEDIWPFVSVDLS